FGQFGSFTHQAALARFGSAAEFVPARSMADVFLLTEKGHTDFGVVPVENSTAGAVIDALDSFVESSLKICAEVTLPITHHLLSHSPLDKIKRVYSIGQALAQNLPHADFIEVGSTTEGAERASREHDAAAVASELAARHFGVPVQQAQIQDFSSNVTRFLVIGKQMSARTGRDKTGLIFGVH
ncbi:MAG: prephenate dehydratase, partial [Chloroflexota bacterium]